MTTAVATAARPTATVKLTARVLAYRQSRKLPAVDHKAEVAAALRRGDALVVTRLLTGYGLTDVERAAAAWLRKSFETYATSWAHSAGCVGKSDFFTAVVIAVTSLAKAWFTRKTRERVQPEVEAVKSVDPLAAEIAYREEVARCAKNRLPMPTKPAGVQ